MKTAPFSSWIQVDCSRTSRLDGVPDPSARVVDLHGRFVFECRRAPATQDLSSLKQEGQAEGRLDVCAWSPSASGDQQFC